MQPTEVRLSRDRTTLTITWDGGARSAIAATLLRERARDARSVRLSVDDWAVPPPAGLTITDVEAIGNYAVRLSFSDGHDRGIFPWAYLAELSSAA